MTTNPTPLPPVAPEPRLSTQSAHPGRATARTLAQNVLGWILAAGVVLPVVLVIVQEELARFLPEGVLAWLVGFVAVAVAISTAVARIMAIPKVDSWLEHVGLSSRPKQDAPYDNGDILP